MIPLNTTMDTVLMLLIAGGVGLIGGIAAAFLETRRPGVPANCGWKKFIGSVFLGGVAAVAVLYFFPPEESVEVAKKVVHQYNLTRLVAFALIVGSAGTSFLLTLQTRALALTAQARVETTEETATETIDGLGKQVPVIAKSAVESAAPAFQKVLEEATALNKRGQITPKWVEKAVDNVVAQTVVSVEQQMAPVVDGAQKTVEAAATEPSK
jgi:hypothetical protein